MPSPTPPLLDPMPVEIRTPKRGALRAAQVWDEHGHWLVGLFPTRRRARDAVRAFLADPGRFPDAVRYSRRCRGRDSRYKWVRKVRKGINTWQARPWLAGHGGLNLGLFTHEDHGAGAEEMAGAFAKRFASLWSYPGRTVAEAYDLLCREWRNKHRRFPVVEIPEHQRGLTVVATEAPEERTERLRRERAQRRASRYRGCGLLDWA